MSRTNPNSGSRGGRIGTPIHIEAPAHIEGKLQIKGAKQYGHSTRLRALFQEAEELGLTAEKEERGKRGYILITPDSPLGGIECRTLDELDEEIANWRE